MSFDDDDFIPDSGALFNFGEIGGDELISKIWIKNDPLKELSCGDDFVVLITYTGRVFSYGKNDWGQLGLGHSNTTMNPISIKSLKNSNEKAVHVACGRCHTLISTESNKLFSFGSNSEGQLGIDDSIRSMFDPTEIKSWDAGPIKQLSAGGEFSAALTENGDLYVWGSNSEGQLGLNDVENDSICTATHLRFFSSPVTTMSCGAYHMAAISVNKLYIWGEAADGKLGLGDGVTTNQNFPQKVLIESSVKQVACGNNHTACLTSSGDVYIWGQGESGQLGLGPSEMSVDMPMKLKLPQNILSSYKDNGSSIEKFVKVSVGERHTAVINAIGLIFAFGDGRHGKLGNYGGSDSYCNRLLPTLIEKLDNSLWADDVECGGCHTVVLIRHRRTSEQLEEVKSSSSILSSTRSKDTQFFGNGSSRGRRHRKADTNEDNGDDNLPTLKYSSLSSTTNKKTKTQTDPPAELEEEISAVNSSLQKSAPMVKSGSNHSLNTIDDLEKVKGQLEKHLITTDKPPNSTSRSETLNENVDRFSELMDTAYGDPVVNNEESTDEIVRKRQKKRRKIKPVQAKQNPIDGFDQSVYNQDMSSDNEGMNNNHPKKDDRPEKGDKNNGSANPEVAKIGCQGSCNGNQKSGACAVL